MLDITTHTGTAATTLTDGHWIAGTYLIDDYHDNTTPIGAIQLTHTNYPGNPHDLAGLEIELHNLPIADGHALTVIVVPAKGTFPNPTPPRCPKGTHT